MFRTNTCRCNYSYTCDLCGLLISFDVHVWEPWVGLTSIKGGALHEHIQFAEFADCMPSYLLYLFLISFFQFSIAASALNIRIHTNLIIDWHPKTIAKLHALIVCSELFFLPINGALNAWWPLSYILSLGLPKIVSHHTVQLPERKIIFNLVSVPYQSSSLETQLQQEEVCASINTQLTLIWANSWVFLLSSGMSPNLKLFHKPLCKRKFYRGLIVASKRKLPSQDALAITPSQNHQQNV